MGLAYLPTWMADFYGKLAGKHTSCMDPMGKANKHNSQWWKSLWVLEAWKAFSFTVMCQFLMFWRHTFWPGEYLLKVHSKSLHFFEGFNWMQILLWFQSLCFAPGVFVEPYFFDFVQLVILGQVTKPVVFDLSHAHAAQPFPGTCKGNSFVGSSIIGHITPANQFFHCKIGQSSNRAINMLGHQNNLIILYHKYIYILHIQYLLNTYIITYISSSYFTILPLF